MSGSKVRHIGAPRKSDHDQRIDAYFQARCDVFELLGYHEDWAKIPLSDRRCHYWMLAGGEAHGGHCIWSDRVFTLETIEGGEVIWSGPIYTQWHLKKWVYRTATHVMVSVDTRTDGNKLLMIFDAERECTDEALREAYLKRWGDV